jgi:hypothetical protein
VIIDPCQHVGQPGLRIEIVEPGGLDQRQHDRGAEGADRASRNVDRLGIAGMVSIPGCARAPNVLWQQC